MIFDLFHSIGRIDDIEPRLNDVQVFKNFFEQVSFAEKLDFNTIWVAESHFSSEVQKRHQNPVIPKYMGEVGLNNDSPQLFQIIKNRTKKINFGTAIFNIVGGNGGPIGAADRIRSMIFHNHLFNNPRHLNIGIASGRFPYINRPFGIVPREDHEKTNWQVYQRLIFVEALEIFLRLSCDDIISSLDVRTDVLKTIEPRYKNRWSFDELKLVPKLPENWRNSTSFVLGTTDPLAHDCALRITDCNIFNLSFTPPEVIEQLHKTFAQKFAQFNRTWQRHKLPRTVLVFIDKDEKKAAQMAHQCFDTYLRAMEATVKTPPKEELMSRALIGNPQMIAEQLEVKFHPDDRLMLWFEFNQTDHRAILEQMELFANNVVSKNKNLGGLQ